MVRVVRTPDVMLLVVDRRLYSGESIGILNEEEEVNPTRVRRRIKRKTLKEKFESNPVDPDDLGGEFIL